ncbi:MAG TPA: hypothetical protein VEX15_18115 [Nocardioidaceae bacterium]|nr:hypothetical protein [Nocardioidaceae bacterium]
MLRSRTLIVAALAAMTVPLLAAAQASAARPTFENISETFNNTINDFCDVDGLDVDHSGTFTSRLKIQKRHGLDYFLEHVHVSEVFVGNDPDVRVTVETAFLQKDLKITDNLDGTITIISLLTGPSTAYGPNGKAIARDPGQVRFRFVIDDNGTPSNPNDDFELSSEVIKGSTGRSDDYCDAIVPFML